MSVLFDTLEYSQKAQKVGFTKEQAEFQAAELSKWINYELVTKSYMQNVQKEIVSTITTRLSGIVITCISILGFIIKH